MRTAEIAGLVLVGVCIGVIGCGGKKPAAGTKEPAADSKPPVVDAAKAAVDSFPGFARQCVVWLRNGLKGQTKAMRDGDWMLVYEIEVSDDYTIDVKKSDSLMSYKGTITVQGRGRIAEPPKRIVAARLPTLGDLPEPRVGVPERTPWAPVVIPCSYRNGQWTTDVDPAQSLLK